MWSSTWQPTTIPTHDFPFSSWNFATKVSPHSWSNPQDHCATMHIQINICHDIALALVYLHSNGLIHRDLTGNNVLMITGTRAKITDFGMSKLATGNPRMTALTLCPGNLLYMSPEALDEVKSYTAKLDIFSFGVIVIQILTREFPNPTDRFRTVQVPQFEEPLRQVVPETERHQSQLKLIPDTHPLKPVVLQCLKREGQRPSAVAAFLPVVL